MKKAKTISIKMSWLHSMETKNKSLEDMEDVDLGTRLQVNNLRLVNLLMGAEGAKELIYFGDLSRV